MPITKNDVEEAISIIKAQGHNVTIDNIRDALGGTGSKTTIQRYRKELLEDENKSEKYTERRSISSQLIDFVYQLADKLEVEVDEKLQIAKSAYAQKEAELNEQNKTLQAEISENVAQLDQLKSINIVQEEQLAEQSRQIADLNRVVIELKHDNTLQQAVIEEKQSNIFSLEEKHKQSREALGHYREAVKEQREQTIREHNYRVQELQVEIREIKQEAQIKKQTMFSLREEINTQKNLVSHLNGRIESLNETLDSLNKHNESLEITLSDNIREIAKIRTLNDSLNLEIAERKQDMVLAQKAIDEKKERLLGKDENLVAMQIQLQVFQYLISA